MKGSITCCMLTVWFLLASFGGAKAEEKVYRDWALRCMEDESGCTLEQRVYVEGVGEAPVVHVAIRRLESEKNEGAAGGLWVVMRVPLEVRLQAGLQVRIDQAAPQKIPLHHCRATGCIALFPLDPRFRRRLETGREARVTFETLDGRGIGVPVSLLGIKAGLKALEDSAQKANRGPQ